MPKSQNGKVAKIDIYLATDTLQMIVIELMLCSLGGHLLPMSTLNNYLPRDNNTNFIFTVSPLPDVGNPK